VIDKARWVPVAGIQLEPNADRAVRETGGSVALAAGPGAGKTELLAQRADFLFRTGASPYPKRILAISFKVDAAQNLRARVRHRRGAAIASRLDSFTFHAFAKTLIDKFRPLLTGENALDPGWTIDVADHIGRKQVTFNELIPLALEIMDADTRVIGALRQTYSHAFFDEFQDATSSQYELIQRAFQGSDVRTTAVGDTKQIIMAWAGAMGGIFDRYVTDFDAERLTLFQNFRSAMTLRRMQNRMIANLEPAAAVDPADLAGDAGKISALEFENDDLEAEALADLIVGWLDAGVPPSEIAVLYRQQPQYYGARLMAILADRGIPFRNEQQLQDIFAEPAGSVIFDFLSVVAADRQAAAYDRLIELVDNAASDDEEGLRAVSAIRQELFLARTQVREFDRTDIGEWTAIVRRFLGVMGRTTLVGLSSEYERGGRLDQLIGDALAAFEAALAQRGDPVEALRDLSNILAVHFLTIHKCKGMEFEKVIVVGVENETFWGKSANEEYFVAISRPKEELVLTVSGWRTRPDGPQSWSSKRTRHQHFLTYAVEP
jgi:superfamily I DNA/RNA helicase